ncbi:MAG: HNH endonuclease [Bacteriovoracaceae bacterium]|nr:HNH endonuclease [Bacteriovoracaceae bacterium]
MNTAHLNDKQLLVNTISLVKNERAISVKVLDHLAEIERRKLYCDLKYSSLFSYCQGELGFSEQEAYRRIDAMRLAKVMPEVKKILENGNLSLTNANMISSLFKKSKLDDDKKLQIVQKVKGMTKKQCETKLDEVKSELGFAPSSIAKQERKCKEVDGGVRLHLSIGKSTYAKLNKLKGLLAHTKDHSTEELLDLMLDNMIEKIEKKKFKSCRPTTPKKQKQQSRYIPKSTKQAVYKKANGKCQNCGSLYALEIDHLESFVKGGDNNSSNLQLLCRCCNRRKAMKEYGVEKIENCTLPGTTNIRENQYDLFDPPIVVKDVT